MSDWQIAFSVAGGLIALFSFSFGIFWKIIQDVKKSSHARMDNLEHTQKSSCDDCPHVKGMERAMSIQHQHLNREVTEIRASMDTNFANLTQRVDNLILAVNNGQNKNRN